MNSIKLNNKYVYHAFPNLCNEISIKQPWIISTGSLTLDLSDVSFIDPFGMISIIGVCRHLHNVYGISSHIVLPTGDSGIYMERAGFTSIQEQDSFIEVSKKRILSFKSLFVDNTNNNVGVLKFFCSEKDIAKINQEVDVWMMHNSFSEDDRNNILTFISEMVQNVVQHSDTPQRGVLCIQSYVKRNGEAFLSWAIGDSGIGIRQSLIDAGLENMSKLNDSSAIKEVVSNGISRFQDDVTRGNGLSKLYKAAKEKRTTLYIHSHSGIYGWDISHNMHKQLEMDIPLISGTNITFYVSQR